MKYYYWDDSECMTCSMTNYGISRSSFLNGCQQYLILHYHDVNAYSTYRLSLQLVKQSARHPSLFEISNLPKHDPASILWRLFTPGGSFLHSAPYFPQFVGPLVSFRFVSFAIAPLDVLCDDYAADLVSDRVPCTEISLHEGGMCHEALRGVDLISKSLSCLPKSSETLAPVIRLRDLYLPQPAGLLGFGCITLMFVSGHRS